MSPALAIFIFFGGVATQECFSEERSLKAAVQSGEIVSRFSGSGKTVGAIGSLTLTNRGNEAIDITIPPLILISSTGKTQDYVSPFSKTVLVAPGKTVNVSLRGICVTRSKPTLTSGEKNEGYAMTQNGQTISLAGSQEVPATDTKYSRKESKAILETTERYFAAAAKLQQEGALDQIPYDDPEVQIETVVQWGVWQDPTINQTTGETPATKEDLTTTIQDQIDAKEDTDLTPQQESQINKGVEDIWAAVDLTAKNVETTQG